MKVYLSSLNFNGLQNCINAMRYGVVKDILSFFVVGGDHGGY